MALYYHEYKLDCGVGVLPPWEPAPVHLKYIPRIHKSVWCPAFLDCQCSSPSSSNRLFFVCCAARRVFQCQTSSQLLSTRIMPSLASITWRETSTPISCRCDGFVKLLHRETQREAFATCNHGRRHAVGSNTGGCEPPTVGYLCRSILAFHRLYINT